MKKYKGLTRPETKQMVFEKSWTEFRETGLLWFVNRLLQVFGWSIVFELEEDTDEVIRVYPVRSKFRMFSYSVEDRGFKKITAYLEANISEIAKDLKE